ncbi:MAG: GIY-YIG nuclease family protein [Corynebacteriales bacterium]|nr:GIY-YIG nuclease family protein [Mycobacteriales bacterium]
MTAPPLQGPTSVYALYGADGRLLYVGVARVGREKERWEEHRRHQQWWPDVHTRHIVGIYPNRAEALAAEAGLIKSARPLHNHIHNGTNPHRVRVGPPSPRARTTSPRSQVRPSRFLTPLLLFLSLLTLLLKPGRGKRGSTAYRVIRRLERYLKRHRQR